MSSAPTKMRCHYEVMGVARDANNDEIKKQYRKLALQWHPDRNYGQEELAAKTFKEISTAYTVLSDPQERKWYDDHRESILRGRDGTAGTTGGDDDDEFEHTINLWQYFNASCYSDMDDTMTGFYTVYRDLFEQICASEKEHTGKDPGYPTFGNSTSPANEVYQFYQYWDNFVSGLNFAWVDKYNVLEAPNRDTRRAMEKENSKERDTARKEYVNRIRSLVGFLKKRDERFLSFEEEKMKKKKEELERKEEMKRQEKERRKELREQWRNSAKVDTEVRDQERVGAYLLADNESDDENAGGGKRGRKGRKGNRKAFLEEDEEDADNTNYAAPGVFETFNSEGVSTMTAALESVAISETVPTDAGDVDTQATVVTEGELAVDEDDDEDDDEEDDDGEVFVCEVCNKQFKTEAQINQHLQSKVHRKKVQELEKLNKKGKKK